MKKFKKICIIGAGPAGLTAAYELSKKKYNVDIFEASSQVGGMCRTINLWGQKVDIGPHRFFSKDPRVNKIWLEVAKKKYHTVKRQTRIFYKNTFFKYPLEPMDALIKLGLIESIYCVISYIKSKMLPQKSLNSFENWVTDKFGKRLFQIFFKSYSEKLWGISCNKIDSDFAYQRIKKLSLIETLKSFLITDKGVKHKTLLDKFAYPENGTGQIYEQMKKKILKNKGKVFLNNKIKSVKINKNINYKSIVTLQNGQEKKYDHIISTMPLTNLVEQLKAPKEIKKFSKLLKFRNTILIYLSVNKKNIFTDQWIYIHNEKLKTGRITNFSNWGSKINNRKKNSIICLEYWTQYDDYLWNKKDKDLIKIAKDELKLSGLVKDLEINNSKVVRIPKCYPIYKIGYKKNLKPIKKWLNKHKELSVIGRYGSFKYNNQDHSILMGLLAAKNISENEKNNLWELNSDYEYQENSKSL